LLGFGRFLFFAGVVRLELAGVVLVEVDWVREEVHPRSCIILSRDSL
jgi:hypothetical protein